MFDKLALDISIAFNQEFNLDIKESDILLEKTNKEFVGDLTFVVFPFLKQVKLSPVLTAERLGAYLINNSSLISEFNVKNGFLNLSLQSSFWLSEFNSCLLNEEDTQLKKPKLYMVEYSSPNTNKPLHLGHLRNNFLGYSISKILEKVGHKVCKTQIVNDRGIHICKSMLAWQLFANNETYEMSSIKGDHFVGKYYIKFNDVYKAQIKELIAKGYNEEDANNKAPILLEAKKMLLKWEQKDEKIRSLWVEMNSWTYKGFEETYNRMGVDFDKIYYESDTFLLGKEIIYKGLKDEIFYQKEDNSIWCNLEEEGLDDKLLLRGDGTSVYITQDIGTAVSRFEDYPSLSGVIYTVGNEQNHHFKVLFAILKKLKYEWANNCFHLSYGMVELPEGKMKSREGTVVDADDLMESIVQEVRAVNQKREQLNEMSEADKTELYEIIGIGSLKYYLLKVDPKRKMLFNPKESIDLNGNTAPFIQYGYARIQSLLKKAELNENEFDTGLKIHSSELILLQSILDYPKMLNEAADKLMPSIVCSYVYNLVKTYNSFYQSVSILKETNLELRKFRLLLSRKTGELIFDSMSLLGINVPNRM